MYVVCINGEKISDNHECFDDVKRQLLNISELLEKILTKKQQTNLAFDNIGEEIFSKEEIFLWGISNVDFIN